MALPPTHTFNTLPYTRHGQGHKPKEQHKFLFAILWDCEGRLSSKPQRLDLDHLQETDLFFIRYIHIQQWTKEMRKIEIVTFY